LQVAEHIFARDAAFRSHIGSGLKGGSSMNASRLSFALVFAAFVGVGCSDDDDTPSTVTDTGTTTVDTGTTPVDTGTEPVDTGTEPTDTGTTPTDTGVTDTGTAGETSTATKHTVTVGSGGNTFSPATLSIKVGDSVEWTWMGDAHTVTEGAGTACTPKPGGFDSGLNNTGFKFTRTFTTAGTVNYICTPHCSLGMKGTITVAP
jgi:plastocyanin